MEHLVEGHLGGYWIDDRDYEEITAYCEASGDYDRVLLSWQEGQMIESLKKYFSSLKYSKENIEDEYKNEVTKTDLIEMLVCYYDNDKIIVTSLSCDNSITPEETKELLRIIKDSLREQIVIVKEVYSKNQEDPVLDVVNQIKKTRTAEEGKRVLIKNFKRLLKNDEISLMVDDSRRNEPISSYFEDYDSMEKWFSEHAEELNEEFKWKQREEETKKIKSDSSYIEWLVRFMKKERKFDDSTWLYCEDELREEDKSNVDKIDCFVDVIVEYADEKNIPSIENDYGYSYNVKYKDTTLKISVLHGQGIITDIELISNENIEDVINYEDIIKINNKSKKLTLKPEDKQKQD